jgi:heme-degrading monooxygenase HmoA
MVDANMTYDLLPNLDPKTWEAFAKKAIATILKAPGIVEFRAYRNLMGTPQILTTSVWNTAADWANFGQSAEWSALERDMRTRVTGLRVELWGPSPVVPKPLHPTK